MSLRAYSSDLVESWPSKNSGYQRDELLVRIAAERGVGALDLGAVEEPLPRLLAQLLGHNLLQEVEDDPLHGAGSLSPSPVEGPQVLFDQAGAALDRQDSGRG